MPWYLDTSAFFKLVVAEDRSDAMRAWAREQESFGEKLWSSDLLRTEALRAARRTAPSAVLAVREGLDRLALITITVQTFEQAGVLEPIVLRSLDALHLAAARSLGDDLRGVVTYDERMAESARSLGIRLLRP